MNHKYKRIFNKNLLFASKIDFERKNLYDCKPKLKTFQLTSISQKTIQVLLN